MARLINYGDDANVMGSDRLIGSDGATKATKNFTVQALADFVGGIRAVGATIVPGAFFISEAEPDPTTNSHVFTVTLEYYDPTTLDAEGIPQIASEEIEFRVPTGASTLRYGNGAPTASTEGNQGDFYLDVVNTVLYGPKPSNVIPFPTEGVSLIGEKGDKGEDGARGPEGPDGPRGIGVTGFQSDNPGAGNATTVTVSLTEGNPETFTVQPGAPGANGVSPTVTQDSDGVTITDSTGTSAKVDDGSDGQSAYALAVSEGFIGDEAAWIASLDGENGESITVASFSNGRLTVGTDSTPILATSDDLTGPPGANASLVGDGVAGATTVPNKPDGSAGDASVTQSGDAQNIDFTFNIPQGIRGEAGPRGFEGPYNLDIYQAIDSSADPSTLSDAPGDGLEYNILLNTFTGSLGGWSLQTDHDSDETLWVIRYRVVPSAPGNLDNVATINQAEWSEPFAAGAQGVPGDTGTRGSQYFSGTSAPTVTGTAPSAIQGDYYVQTDSGVLYLWGPKGVGDAVTGWPARQMFSGPMGQTGASAAIAGSGITDVNTIPNNPDGTAGQATVVQVGADAQNISFVFGLPVGPEGERGPQGRFTISLFMNASDRPMQPHGTTYNTNNPNPDDYIPSGWTTEPSTPNEGENIWEVRGVVDGSIDPDGDGIVPLNWSVPFEAGAAGPSGTDGIDGTDGKDGAQGFYTTFIYREAATGVDVATIQPDGATGSGIATAPDDWSFAPSTPGSGNTLYLSTSVYNPGEPTAELTWSVPFPASSGAGPQGPAGLNGNDAFLNVEEDDSNKSSDQNTLNFEGPLTVTAEADKTTVEVDIAANPGSTTIALTSLNIGGVNYKITSGGGTPVVTTENAYVGVFATDPGDFVDTGSLTEISGAAHDGQVVFLDFNDSASDPAADQYGVIDLPNDLVDGNTVRFYFGATSTGPFFFQAEGVGVHTGISYTSYVLGFAEDTYVQIHIS